MYPVKRPEDYTKDELCLIAVVETSRSINLANDWIKKMFGGSYAPLPVPTVLMDIRLGSMLAGQAWTKGPRANPNTERIVRFHEGLMRQNVNDYIQDTIPHEVAHLVADYVWKTRCNHDARWYLIMKEVYGIDASRCHTYDDVKEEVKAACKRRK